MTSSLSATLEKGVRERESQAPRERETEKEEGIVQRWKRHEELKGFGWRKRGPGDAGWFGRRMK